MRLRFKHFYQHLYHTFRHFGYKKIYAIISLCFSTCYSEKELFKMLLLNPFKLGQHHLEEYISLERTTKMIKLTTSTGINQKTKKKFDNSLYLVRIDSNNLALKRGDKTLNYFGDVRTALTKSLNYAIKGSDVALSLESILDSIHSLDKSIKTLRMDAVEKESENEIS